MKKVFKSRVFLCIVVALVFGTIGVSAATYFPSVDVTYDNKESGLVSTDVQGAIDELYGICSIAQITGPATDILDKVNTVTSGDGLYKDEYEDGRYFYRGTNPNNYITFNGENAGWRIVSLEADGMIKIVKINSIGTMKWDDKNTNNWLQPASLNTYLNGTYYNSLTSTAQNQIGIHGFSIGSVVLANSDLMGQIEDENIAIWYGKVGLFSASEYIRSNSDMSKCGIFEVLYNNKTACNRTSWISNAFDGGWMISALNNTSGNSVRVEYTGALAGNNGGTASGDDVYPAVYLSSSVKLSGNGTLSEPYEIS